MGSEASPLRGLDRRRPNDNMAQQGIRTFGKLGSPPMPSIHLLLTAFSANRSNLRTSSRTSRRRQESFLASGYVNNRLVGDFPERPLSIRQDMTISPRRSSMTTSPRFAAYRRARNRSFTKFARLPAEIQLMIWRYAVPDPREVDNAIPIIVNFDLQNPRAILPAPKELRELHEPGCRRFLTGESELMDAPTWSMVNSPVLHLLHTCHDARSAVLNTFCLDIDAVSGVWNHHLWDPETDVLYLPVKEYAMNSIITMWLSKARERGLPGLFSARDIALRLSLSTLRQLSFRPDFASHDSANLLCALPALQSLRLFIDPGNISDKNEGRIALYKAEDIPGQLYQFGPSEIERRVTKILKTSRNPDLETPTVEVSVMSWKQPRTS